MKKTLAKCLAGLAVLTSTGCGTICNLAGSISHPESEPTIYGGIRKDLEVMEELMSQPVERVSRVNPQIAALLGLVVVSEPILSCVGDTLTLPVTIYLQERRAAAIKNDEHGNSLTQNQAP